MSGPLKFAGRVVVVTGAGAGLGRSYALAFAERGAKVVVNDLGGSAFGDGKSAKAADKVVAEIEAKGGKAVANYDSVENGERIVKTAIENFGRLDILVNNAGILRDRSFLKMTHDDWEKVLQVHLTGAYKTTHAAWPVFRKQNYGRVIMTTSPTGLYGNFGQTNYGAAKAGLIGLTKSLAKEGQKYNIFTNVVAPNAGTRMTETVMPSDIVDMLKPEFCVPVVLNLASEESLENGSIFETGGGWTAKVKYFRTEGAALPPGERESPEALRDRWSEVADFEQGPLTATTSAMETAQQVIRAAKEAAAEKAGTPTTTTGTWRDAVGKRLPKYYYKYTPNEAILYALGIGCSQRTPTDLRYLYEGDDNFSVFPTFAVIFAQEAMFQLGGIPDIPVDLTRLLHGESYLKIFKPLPKWGHVRTDTTVTDIMDKKSGAAFVLDAVTRCADSGEQLAHNQFVVFIKGSGGFGGTRTSEKQQPMVALDQSEKARRPDAERGEQIPVDLNALYRLTGDKNPMHIDPSFSAIGGFPKPILHGLCSLAFATRHILDTYSSAKFVSLKVRFTKPVLPGQTLRTKMWKRDVPGGNKFLVLFQTAVEETGEVCLHGHVEMTGSDLHSKMSSKL